MCCVVLCCIQCMKTLLLSNKNQHLDIFLDFIKRVFLWPYAFTMLINVRTKICKSSFLMHQHSLAKYSLSTCSNTQPVCHRCRVPGDGWQDSSWPSCGHGRGTRWPAAAAGTFHWRTVGTSTAREYKIHRQNVYFRMYTLEEIWLLAQLLIKMY